MRNLTSGVPPSHQPRVLVVDGDPTMFRRMVDALAGEFDVLSASTGNEALSQLAADPAVAVVISDINVPCDPSGADLLGFLSRSSPDVVRVALTADSSSAAVLSAVNGGHVYRFLTKPIAPELLLSSVREAVDHRRVVTADRDLLRARLDDVATHMWQTERMATLGRLAAGVGHELSNVSGVLTMLLDEVAGCRSGAVAPDDELVSQLERVTAHVTTYARCLLHLGRQRKDALEAVDVKQMANDVVRMLGSIGRTRHIAVRCEVREGDATVQANRTRLEQVLTNLLINAADAATNVTDRSVEVVVRVQRVGDEVELVVSDNATGISPEDLARIYEPYFTTKGVEQGTGLGLAIVRQIVEAFGGALGVESALGVGTTFTMRWPVLQAGVRRSVASAAA